MKTIKRIRRKQKLKAAVPSFNASDLANIAKANPYIQRLVEDADLRENVQTAIESTRKAYDRVGNGKVSAKSLLDDKKLQSELRSAVEAVRDAASALSDAPKRKRSRRLVTAPRVLVLVGVGAGGAVAASEKLRSKVLDKLFGAEEEFEYTPPASTPATPVSAA
ncbi:MAG: hypothetical protein ACR2IP_04020 [Solirubrobacteraceae bacterium]